MRGHERLVLFQISATGLVWWALVNTHFMYPEMRVVGSLLPVLLALYGLLNHYAVRTFIRVSDRYVKERIEISVYGEKKGFLEFYYSHHQRSMTSKSRILFWYGSIFISLFGTFLAFFFPEYLQTIPGDQ